MSTRKAVKPRGSSSTSAHKSTGKSSSAKSTKSQIGKATKAVTEEARSLTLKFVEATHSGDGKLLGNLVSDDFLWVDERGTAMMRSQCVAAISALSTGSETKRALQVESFRISDLQVRSYGAAVIETLRYTDTVSTAGQQGAVRNKEKRDFRVTAVWINDGKQQSLVSVHMSSIQGGK